MRAVRSRPRWTLAVLVLGLAVLALSPIPGWLMHSRVVGGEGYRTLTLALNAWQLRAVPVLSLGAVTAALAGLAVLLSGARPWLPVMVAVPLGLLAAGLLPLSHSAHVTSVQVNPGLTLLVALAAVAAMALLVLRAARPPRRVLLAAAAVLVAVAIAGGVGRVVQLHAAEAVSAHWSPGTYTRQGAQGGALTLSDTSYASGAWSGSLEAAGTSIILTTDPACPNDRGYYHVRAAGNGRILVEKVIDICADGDRASDLEGVWQPAAGATAGGTP